MQLLDYYNQIQDIFSNSIFQDYGSIGLFVNSVLSATALPIPTEPLVASLLAGGESKFIIGVALFSGSVIGGVVNYWIGRGGGQLGNKIKLHFKTKPVTESDIKKQSKVETILIKMGWFGIFFAPFILVVGDLILITAGAKKFDFLKFIFVMVSGKLFKTIVIVLGLGVLFH